MEAQDETDHPRKSSETRGGALEALTAKKHTSENKMVHDISLSQKRKRSTFDAENPSSKINNVAGTSKENSKLSHCDEGGHRTNSSGNDVVYLSQRKIVGSGLNQKYSIDQRGLLSRLARLSSWGSMDSADSMTVNVSEIDSSEKPSLPKKTAKFDLPKTKSKATKHDNGSGVDSNSTDDDHSPYIDGNTHLSRLHLKCNKSGKSPAKSAGQLSEKEPKEKTLSRNCHIESNAKSAICSSKDVNCIYSDGHIRILGIENNKDHLHRKNRAQLSSGWRRNAEDSRTRRVFGLTKPPPVKKDVLVSIAEPKMTECHNEDDVGNTAAPRLHPNYSDKSGNSLDKNAGKLTEKRKEYREVEGERDPKDPVIIQSARHNNMNIQVSKETVSASQPRMDCLELREKEGWVSDGLYGVLLEAAMKRARIDAERTLNAVRYVVIVLEKTLHQEERWKLLDKLRSFLFEDRIEKNNLQFFTACASYLPLTEGDKWYLLSGLKK